MATADWLYNYPRGRIFPPFVWQRSKRFFRRDAGFSAPLLPTPAKELLLVLSFPPLFRIFFKRTLVREALAFSVCKQFLITIKRHKKSEIWG